MKALRPLVLPLVLAVAVVPLSGCGQVSAPASGPGTPAAVTGRPSTASDTAASTPSSPAVSHPPAPTLTPDTPGSTMDATLRTVKTGDVTLTALMGVGAAKYPDGPGGRKRAGLAVDYTLVNQGQRSLAVYDRVPDDLGSAALGQINPEHAWVFMNGPVLRVSKQSFDTAPNVRFAALPVTGIRPLPAGGNVKGRAWVPLPPKLDVPGKSFASPGGRGLALDIVTWQFCVQVGDIGERIGPVTDSSPDKADAAPDAVLGSAQTRSAPASAPGPGELICTKPVPLVTP